MSLPHGQPRITKRFTGTHSEPCQTSKKERFAKTVNELKPSKIFIKRSILDVWQDSEWFSVYFLSITPWKFENFDELQLPYSSIFFTETLLTFPTYQYLQKGLRDFFYFVWILSYLQKLKRTGSYTLAFFIFIMNSRLNKIKKNSKHPFLDIIK